MLPWLSCSHPNLNVRLLEAVSASRTMATGFATGVTLYDGELKWQDAIAFAEASPTIQQCYYASIPQLGKMIVQSYESSIPCCGQRNFLQQHSVCCSNCYSWQHLECVGLIEWSPSDLYVCWECKKVSNNVTLEAGGIHMKCVALTLAILKNISGCILTILLMYRQDQIVSPV